MSANMYCATLTGDELTQALDDLAVSTTSEGAYGITINLRRIGNLVNYWFNSRPNGMAAARTSIEILPLGYRPLSNVATVLRSTRGEAGEWAVNANGTSSWWINNPPGNDPITVNLIYFTGDPYPTS